MKKLIFVFMCFANVAGADTPEFEKLQQKYPNLPDFKLSVVDNTKVPLCDDVANSLKYNNFLNQPKNVYRDNAILVYVAKLRWSQDCN